MNRYWYRVGYFDKKERKWHYVIKNKGMFKGFTTDENEATRFRLKNAVIMSEAPFLSKKNIKILMIE